MGTQKRSGGKRPSTVEKALSTSVNISSLFSRDIFDVKTSGEAKDYARLSKNPIVKNAFDNIESAAMWPNMSIQARSDYKENPTFEKLDNEIISFVNNQLENLEYESNTNVMRATLRKGRTFGFTVGEMVWGSSGTKAKPIWNLKSIKPKPSYNFEFYVKTNDDIDFMMHTPTNTKIQGDDLNNYIIGTWPWLEDGNYHGVSELNAVYHELRLLEELEGIRTKGTSKAILRKMLHYFASMGKAPGSQNNLMASVKKFAGEDDLIQIPSKIDQNTGKLLKYSEFEILDDRPSKEALSAINIIIDELKKDIKRALGVPDDVGSTTTDAGSYAKSKVEYSIFGSNAESAANWILALWNRCVIHNIIRYNFTELPEGYKEPQMQVEAIEEEWASEKVSYFANAIQARIIDAEEPFIRESLGFPPAPKDRVIEDEAAEDEELAEDDNIIPIDDNKDAQEDENEQESEEVAE